MNHYLFHLNESLTLVVSEKEKPEKRTYVNWGNNNYQKDFDFWVLSASKYQIVNRIEEDKFKDLAFKLSGVDREKFDLRFSEALKQGVLIPAENVKLIPCLPDDEFLSAAVVKAVFVPSKQDEVKETQEELWHIVYSESVLSDKMEFIKYCKKLFHITRIN